MVSSRPRLFVACSASRAERLSLMAFTVSCFILGLNQSGFRINLLRVAAAQDEER